MYIGKLNKNNEFEISYENYLGEKIILFSHPVLEKFLPALNFYSKHVRYFNISSYYDRIYGNTMPCDFYIDAYNSFHNIKSYIKKFDKISVNYYSNGNGSCLKKTTFSILDVEQVNPFIELNNRILRNYSAPFGGSTPVESVPIA